ncbi:serine/threonine protein kinase [Candidatus Uabimicrobium amorphum]|uniref:Serine/threonine protein kinase n=1 Tax=Uabimicrobium amorphum TaxID=2596890 RepID=A0A5S9IT16_UABAM|nr:serine/threonine-protein kinase [Candidatus Uabimicrobium amorphum]BBM86115.1 serine/threonine protein kinase [Candidatus Uabimicrobium amorphum]
MEDLKYLSHYKIIKKIASGGMGNIYLAEQLGARGFSKTVAIKTIRSSLLSDMETLDMFIGEAKLVANLIHANIVQVYHFEKVDNFYYLIMEYVEGVNLENLLKRHNFMKNTIPVDITAYIVSQICRGLDYAHRKRDHHGKRLKIVHRDISPSNVILTTGGIAKLTDFGIAKAMTMKTPDERLVIMGKYPYMSPEQAQFEGTDPRSDIYSLGIVAYELFTGQMVFNVRDDIELIEAMRVPVTPLHEVNTAIPPELSNIIMKAISLSPKERFQSAKKMGESIDKFLHDHRCQVSNSKLAKYLELLFPENKTARLKLHEKPKI